MDERCENCRFFKRQEGFSGGHCRRFPPTIVGNLIESERYGREITWDQTMPYTQIADWCGEWSAVSASAEQT
jgi:hypothetical protein